MEASALTEGGGGLPFTYCQQHRGRGTSVHTGVRTAAVLTPLSPWHHVHMLIPALPNPPRIHLARVSRRPRGFRQRAREVAAGTAAQSDRVSSAPGGDSSVCSFFQCPSSPTM